MPVILIPVTLIDLVLDLYKCYINRVYQKFMTNNALKSQRHPHLTQKPNNFLEPLNSYID